MTTAQTIRSIHPGDYVQIRFMRTTNARAALRQLWAMHGEGSDDMLILSVGSPRAELPDEELWMRENWEGNLVRSFRFDAREAFDSDRFQSELGGQIESIQVSS